MTNFPGFSSILRLVFLGLLHAHGLPAILTPMLIVLTLLGLTLAVIHRGSFQRQSVALLSVLAVMFSQDMMLIVMGVHLELVHPDQLAAGLGHFFFDLNFGLALAGIVAAIGVAVYVRFRKSRLSLTRFFPQYRFLEAPRYVGQMVERLAATAGVPLPEVSLLDSGIPWAFVTRSEKESVLVVSVGLLESLEPAEIEACLAHEISHLKNKDFILRFFATMAKVGMFARPLSYFIEPALYRAREHLADRTACKLVGGPNALMSALSKIRESRNYGLVEERSIQVACLLNPVGRSRFARLFDKQPTLESRIKVLQDMKY